MLLIALGHAAVVADRYRRAVETERRSRHGRRAGTPAGSPDGGRP